MFDKGSNAEINNVFNMAKKKNTGQRDYATADLLKAKCDEYFRTCDEDGALYGEAGLALHLNVTIETLRRWYDGKRCPDFQETAQMAYLRIQNQIETDPRYQEKGMMQFANGSTIKFGHYDTGSDLEYQGQEFDWIFIDEATQFTEAQFRILGACLRGTSSIPRRMISLMTLAYPKVVFDRTRIVKWDNRVGAAIGVNGSVENVSKIVDPATISPQIAQFIDLAVSYTQKFLGASDVAMGDTRPDNTSAIIALQRAAATPMELTKQNLLQSVEDLGRIYMTNDQKRALVLKWAESQLGVIEWPAGSNKVKYNDWYYGKVGSTGAWK